VRLADLGRMPTSATTQTPGPARALRVCDDTLLSNGTISAGVRGAETPGSPASATALTVLDETLEMDDWRPSVDGLVVLCRSAIAMR
jgi:hypothetical protein